VVTTAFILAEGLGGLGDVLFIVVVVVLVLIGKLFQKNAEQRQEKENEQRGSEDRETMTRRRQEGAAERPAPPTTRLAPVPAPDRAATPAAPAPTAPPTPAARKTKEQRLEARHLQDLETAEVGRALASRRLKGARVSSRKKPGRLDAADEQAVQGAVRAMLNVDLSGRGQARQAILYHEIFSSPKALRSGKEMWDR